MLLIVYFVIVTVALNYSLALRYGLMEVGEQAPDVAMYITFGKWNFSLKNPFYDIIHVDAFWVSIFHMLFNIDNIINAIPTLLLYTTLTVLLVSLFLVSIEKQGSNILIYILSIFVFTPYLLPSLSALYAMLLIYLFTRYEHKWNTYIAITILALAGTLTHASFTAMTIFFLLSLLMSHKFLGSGRDQNLENILKILTILLTLHFLITLIRFFYTSAYISLYPYYADVLNFFNVFLGAGEAKLRESRYELYAPLFTAFSWSLLVALATSYLLYCLTHRKSCNTYRQLVSLSLIFGGLILISIGFVGSFFSNSFSREAGYPGYMLLLLGSIEPIRLITRNRRSEVIFLTLIILGLISGMYTVKNAPELYVGQIPYLTYRPPTPGEGLLARNLVESGFLEPHSRVILLTPFDPGTFTVYFIQYKIIDPIDLTRKGIELQALPMISQALKSNTADSVILNADQFKVILRG
ncbi:MAG: hypothetical protein ACP5IE_04615 [Infirmifilum sp.]